jgi:hypothetical protein
MVNSSQDEHGLYTGIGVRARSARLAGFLVVEPELKDIFIKPNSKATALSKRFVILRPVADAVLLLFLLFHKLRITASPHPYLFMQQRHARGLTSRVTGRASGTGSKR